MNFNKLMITLAAVLLIVGLWVNWPSSKVVVTGAPVKQLNDK